MKILGISAFYHDSAAAIIVNGKIIAAAQEERFSRVKHDSSFPKNSIQYCLKETNLNLDSLDAIIFYDDPVLKFHRVVSTYICFFPKGILSFIRFFCIWARRRFLLRKTIQKELYKLFKGSSIKDIRFLFSKHHLSHASSAYYASPYLEAAIVTLDGVGEWATTSICYGYSNKIEKITEIKFPHSLGLLYSAFTDFLGFRVNSGEYKLMGLAPYGIKNSEEVNRFKKIIKEKLIDIKSDGSFWLNQKYFIYATDATMVDYKKWQQLFGFARREYESEIEQCHCNLALAIQDVTEEIFLMIVRKAKELTKSENICLAGGVALNCVCNGKLLEENIFKNVYIQPASGDAGGAIGAALAAYYIYFNKERETAEENAMKGAYLGPQFTDAEIEHSLAKLGAKFKYYSDFDLLTSVVAEKISNGNVIGWFQGRMEFGPRALGNRSIIADARNSQMQRKLNLKVKYRESFRPFAPSILIEDYEKYILCNNLNSPYMLLVLPIVNTKRKMVPAGYNTLSLIEKLYIEKSEIQSVTHVDFSARVQTIDKSYNEKFWTLINAFKEITGDSIVINTSFNVRGEPIVCNPEEAFKCFMRTDIDFLVLGNFLLDKTNQPQFEEKKDWRLDYILD